MPPGVDLNISQEVWLDYQLFIAKLRKKNNDISISASKRIEDLIKRDMEESKEFD